MFTNFALIELCKRQDLANAHCFWRFLDFTYHSVALMDLSMQRLVVSKDGLKLCIVDFSEVGRYPNVSDITEGFVQTIYFVY